MNPVIIGTIFWVIVGLFVGWKVINYVGEKSPLGKEWENQKYFSLYLRIALVALIFGWIQMWALWACCYMHQMYPLI